MGNLYLGRLFNSTSKRLEKELEFDSKNLTTHAVCVGMTGSGKTGLGVVLLEELALQGIPAIAIDPKGDLGNLLLTFPDLKPADFLPWIDSGEAQREGKNPEEYAAEVAEHWRQGLAKWGETGQRIDQFKNAVESVIYTPASSAGIPISILNSFTAPPEDLLHDAGAMRERVLSTTSSLLGLLGINADPIKSREQILISTLLDNAWQQQKNLSLAQLIQEIFKPPFAKIGVLDLETFYPHKDRMALANRLNNLLASPGFQIWMEGEPLDIQNILYSKEGKPRLAIITIAHLSDPERMFFVTLLLNEMISWMRRQTGTSSLRALLYMDEIFGYFPPNGMPPSKIPMLTLLKQARAFGLGVVLATQNPVDLDYKGLANCGTWFIGKLQTERDKKRVLEGLKGNEKENSVPIDQMIAASANQIFILRSIYLSEPVLFQTRWALSYLRGPLTLSQIEIVMANKRDNRPQKIDKKSENEKPALPLGIDEYFVHTTNPFPLYQAQILGIAKLHFVDTKIQQDIWQKASVAAPANGENGLILWQEEGQTLDSNAIEKGAPPLGSFAPLSSSMMQIKNYPVFSKSLADYLYQNQILELYEYKEGKLISNPQESENDFRKRASSLAKAQIEEKRQKILVPYDSKIGNLQEKIQRAQDKAATYKSQVWRQAFDTALSFLTTILSAFMGKKITKGSIGQAGTALRKAGKISKEQTGASQAEESWELLQQQLESLQNEKDLAEKKLQDSFDPEKIVIEKKIIRPRKTDIAIETVALIWISK